jgi:signal transduction histidine kinase
VTKPTRDEDWQLAEQADLSRQYAMCGRLVSGLVHEINNPLDGVINCLRRIRSGKLTPEREQEYLALAEQELFRLASLTRRLLGLARENLLTLARADLNEMVQKSLFFVEYRRTQSRVRLRRSLEPDLPPVNADQTSILQVIVNLLQNAIDSMPEGGVLTVKTASDGRWVRFAVGDSGSGITTEDLGRIFQPFFTTKPGTGTGLGLAISQSIAEQHQGGITVESTVGKGSTFTLRLPRLANGGKE